MGASAFLSLRSPPPPPSLGVSRPICVPGPSLWQRPWRGGLSRSPLLSLSLFLSLSLGWTAGRTRECGAVVCAHMGAGEGERGSVMDRDRERVKKEERAAPVQPRL